jgi:ABC-type glycerol-3-phosphate transport system substrate-binding protein
VSRNILLVVVLIVALVAAVVLGGCASKPAPAPSPTVEKPAVEKPTAEKPKIDPNQVPIQIVAYYPLNESHTFIKEYLESVAKVNPGNITVEFNDMQSEEGRKKWSDSGLTCAGVFINGATHHELAGANGKPEGVDTLQRMDVFWTHQDFEKVLTQILKKAGKEFVSPKYVAPKAAETTPAEKPASKPGASKG